MRARTGGFVPSSHTRHPGPARTLVQSAGRSRDHASTTFMYARHSQRGRLCVEETGRSDASSDTKSTRSDANPRDLSRGFRRPLAASRRGASRPTALASQKARGSFAGEFSARILTAAEFRRQVAPLSAWPLWSQAVGPPILELFRCRKATTYMTAGHRVQRFPANRGAVLQRRQRRRFTAASCSASPARGYRIAQYDVPGAAGQFVQTTDMDKWRSRRQKQQPSVSPSQISVRADPSAHCYPFGPSVHLKIERLEGDSYRDSFMEETGLRERRESLSLVLAPSEADGPSEIANPLPAATSRCKLALLTRNHPVLRLPVGKSTP